MCIMPSFLMVLSFFSTLPHIASLVHSFMPSAASFFGGQHCERQNLVLRGCSPRFSSTTFFVQIKEEEGEGHQQRE